MERALAIRSPRPSAPRSRRSSRSSLEGVDLPPVAAAALEPSLTVFHAVALAPDEVRRELGATPPPPASLVASREAVVEAVPGGSRIALTARLNAPVPPLGPGEAVRKTLVFHLAMELLGLGATPP